MAIPESQLQTWSHQGAVTTSSGTYASIRNALNDASSPYSNRNFEVFLQGSYANTTNIRGDSDVDVVIMLKSIFRSYLNDLPPDQMQAYRQTYPDATYRLSEFKSGVVSRLQAAFGYHTVAVGNKAVKVAAASGRLGADVVVCHQYRDYRYFFSDHNQDYNEGVLLVPSSGADIINYPRLHRSNCTAKHQNTSNWFKPTVRMFKNMRSRLVDSTVLADDTAPSYFVEGLLYNVPDGQFGGSFQDTFCNCVNWLREADRSKFVCANGKLWLSGPLSTQWSQDNCTRFLNALVDLWNGW